MESRDDCTYGYLVAKPSISQTIFRDRVIISGVSSSSLFTVTSSTPQFVPNASATIRDQGAQRKALEKIGSEGELA